MNAIFAYAPCPPNSAVMPIIADGAPTLAERESVGLELRRKRKENSIEVARAAELGGVSVAQLGNIERGTHSLTSMSAGNLSRLPAAFGLNWSQFVEIISPVYGPYIALLPTPDPLSIKQPGYHPEPVFPARVVAHYGSVGAGLNPVSHAETFPEHRSFPNVAGLEGYRDDELFTLDVIGDSMTCDEIKKTIPEGSVAIFCATCEALPGDIVAVWLEREQIGVLKKYSVTESGHVVLRSYNDHHKPIIIEPSDKAVVQGVYLTHMAPVRRGRVARRA